MLLTTSGVCCEVHGFALHSRELNLTMATVEPCKVVKTCQLMVLYERMEYQVARCCTSWQKGMSSMEE